MKKRYCTTSPCSSLVSGFSARANLAVFMLSVVGSMKGKSSVAARSIHVRTCSISECRTCTSEVVFVCVKFKFRETFFLILHPCFPQHTTLHQTDGLIGIFFSRAKLFIASLYSHVLTTLQS